MKIVYNYEDILKDYHGKIWLIDSENCDIYNDFAKENLQIINEPIKFETNYHDYIYTIALLEKK